MMLIDLESFLRDQRIALGQFQISIDHLFDELFEARRGHPTELRARLRRVPQQSIDLGRTKVTSVYLDDDAPGSRIGTRLIDAVTVPYDLHPEMFSGRGYELPDRMLFASRYDVVFRRALLQHQPLRFDIVPRVPPISHRVEVTKVHAVLEPFADSS